MGDDVEKFEDLLDHLGVGRWTLLNIVILVSWQSLPAMQALGAGFIAPMINYTCHLPDDGDPQQALHEGFGDVLLPQNEPVTVSPRDECSFLVTNGSGWHEERCTKWDFDNSTFTTTITSEMELVCEREFLVPLYQSMYMIGAVVGAWLGGLLSDKFGRRPVAVGSTFVLVSTGICSSWLPNINLIIIARFFLGFCHMSGKGAVYGLVTESVPPRLRATVALPSGIGWGLTVSVLGLLGYYVREWRRLQLLMSVPYIILVPVILLLDESPRWLIVHGRRGAAFRLLTKVAAWHRVPLPPAQKINSIMDEILAKESRESNIDGKLSLADHLKVRVKELIVLVRTPKIRKLTLVIWLDFFTASLVYFSLSLGAKIFKIDPYIFMALGGIVDSMSCLLAMILLNRVGRKIPAIACYLVTGVTLVGIYFIPEDLSMLTLAMVLIGRLAINSVFSEMYLYSSEIYPTELRLQGLGTGLFVSRTGSILSPFFNDLLTPLFPWAMNAVAGGLSLMAGFSTFYLPETKDVEMPDFVTQIEENAAFLRKV